MPSSPGAAEDAAPAVPRSFGPPSGGPARVRVLLVDDSIVARGWLSRVLSADPELHVVGAASNGRRALDVLREHPADVVVLDVEMPEMDGLTALPLLLRQQPAVRVLMLSAHTGRGAAVTMRALALGAADFVCKPAAGTPPETHAAELTRKIVALGRGAQRAAARVAEQGNGHPVARAASRAATSPAVGRPGVHTPNAARGAVRPAIPTSGPTVPRPMQVLVVAASTGGPVALTDFLRALAAPLAVPILITQHMPPEFTRLLAERLAVAGGRPCAEARDGELLRAGRAYVAPGDHHMRVERRGTDVHVRLTQEPPAHHCRPAADVMFASASAAYGAGTLGVVLTGMGCDGRDGSAAIVRVGGHVLAQDEASSVVWGMPGAVANAGLAAAVLPIPQLAAHAVACCAPRHAGTTPAAFARQ